MGTDKNMKLHIVTDIKKEYSELLNNYKSKWSVCSSQIGLVIKLVYEYF